MFVGTPKHEKSKMVLFLDTYRDILRFGGTPDKITWHITLFVVHRLRTTVVEQDLACRSESGKFIYFHVQ